MEQRRQFFWKLLLAGVMASLELDQSGRSALKATDALQGRFGHLLVASHAASHFVGLPVKKPCT